MAIAALPRNVFLKNNPKTGIPFKPIPQLSHLGAAEKMGEVYHYTFNDLTNLVLHDSAYFNTNQGNNLTAPNTISVFWDPDFGGCLNFAHNTNGLYFPYARDVNQYDTTSDVSNTVPTAVFGWEFWLKTTSTTQDIFSIQGDAGANSMTVISVGNNAFGIGGDHKLNFSWRSSSGSLKNIGSYTAVDDGAWHFATVWFGSGGIFISVDGDGANTSGVGVTGSQTFVNGGGAPLIHPNLGVYSHPYTGKLKNFRMGRFGLFDGTSYPNFLGHINAIGRNRWGSDYIGTLPNRRLYSAPKIVTGTSSDDLSGVDTISRSAPYRIQAMQNPVQNVGSSFTGTLPNPATAGNTIIGFFLQNGTNYAVTMPSGWSLDLNNGNTQLIGHYPARGGETSFTLNTAGTTTGLFYLEEWAAIAIVDPPTGATTNSSSLVTSAIMTAGATPASQTSVTFTFVAGASNFGAITGPSPNWTRELAIGSP